MAQSSIEWTEMTWNPTTGCDKISAGCKYCYAEVMARRLQAMGIEKYRDGFELRLHEDALQIPYDWKKPNELHDKLNWTTNIWMGVSVENEKAKDRIDFLRGTNAKVKFLSCEPLIGPLQNLDLEKIHWAIVGGESGRKARHMKEWWVWNIRQQCADQGVAFFFKQWGGTNKKKTGRELGE